MADAAGRALGASPVARRAARGHGALAQVNAIGPSLGGSVQILTPAKVNEIFHSDWTAHDRRLAAALGFRPALRSGDRLRRDDLVVPAARVALELVKYARNKLSFHKESPVSGTHALSYPGPLEPLLRTAHELTVENDGIADTLP
jgi:hypothetical protein